MKLPSPARKIVWRSLLTNARTVSAGKVILTILAVILLGSTLLAIAARFGAQGSIGNVGAKAFGLAAIIVAMFLIRKWSARLQVAVKRGRFVNEAVSQGATQTAAEEEWDRLVEERNRTLTATPRWRRAGKRSIRVLLVCFVVGAVFLGLLLVGLIFG